MFTMSDIRTLTSRPVRPANTVLTLYLDVDQSQPANLNRGFEKQLKDMLVSVRKAITSEDEMKAFQTASERVADFVARYSVGARGLIVIFDTSDGFLWNREVDFPAQSQIRWGKEGFIQPLVVAIDEYERVGIVLVDRATVRLFTMSLGAIDEHIREEFDRTKIRHTKTAGMNRLGSASHLQRKADEQVRSNLRHVVKDIDWMLAQHGVRRIILAGSPQVTAKLHKILPKRLASEVIGTVDIAISATIEEVRKVSAPVAQKFEWETEKALVRDLVTEAAKAGRAVVGLGHTLHALNQGRIWQLICVDGFHSPGYECSRCAALFSVESTSCSFCGSPLSRIDDVVHRAVDRAVRKGVRIEVIRNEEAESSLMNAGGIGGFLRTVLYVLGLMA